MNSALKTRAKLSVHQVVDIFQLKKNMISQPAAQVARQYDVSEKTVRDIWAGRTWSSETWHLDTTRILQHKQIGRPKGCRDSKPRKHKERRDDLKTCQRASKRKDMRSADQQLQPKALGSAQMQSASSNSARKFEPEKTEVDRDRHPTQHPSRRGVAPSRIDAPAVPSSSGESVDQLLFEWELASRLPLPANDHAPHRQAAAKRGMPGRT
jgi:hypothetical protein